MSLFAELKRRNVFRVGIAYAVAGWLLVQVGDVARESFEAPAWVMKMFITAIITGFPIVMFFSWAYEITPEGIKREKDVERGESVVRETSRRLNFITIALLIGVMMVVAVDRFMPGAQAPEATTVTETVRPEPANTPTEAPIRQNSIAVMPFVNMSNDPDQEYFSDGISEELLNLLAQVDGLNVASRTSSFAFKGSNASIPDIATDLKVRNVLEGSVRKAGNRVRITAQLIDTSNDRHLWSDSYDRDLDDIFSVQDEIANAIVDALTLELGLDLQDTEIEVYAVTEDMDAYDLYLQARELTIARSSLPRAVELLEEAVQRDPGFARAWSMLGMAAYLVTSWEVLDPEARESFMEQARQAVNRAIDLDNKQALAWAVLGMMGSQEGAKYSDFSESFRLLDKATELDPNNATAWLWRGIRHSEAGYITEAISDIAQCLEIDPAYQNCRRHLAVNLWVNGDSEKALATYTDLARTGFTRNDAAFVPIFFSSDQELAGLIALSYFEVIYPGFPAVGLTKALEFPERDHTDVLPLAKAWLERTDVKPTGVEEMIYLALRNYEELQVNQGWVNNFTWYPSYPHFRRSEHFQRFINDMNLPAYWKERGLPPQCTQRNDQFICTSPAEMRNASNTAQRRVGDGT